MTSVSASVLRRMRTDLSLNHHILWNLAPVATTNLLDCGIIKPSFHRSLERAAVESFKDYRAKRRGAKEPFNDVTSREFENSKVAGRRRKRSLLIPNETRQRKAFTMSPSESSPNSQDASACPTDNDRFFEYQRLNGYRLKPQYHDSDIDANHSTCDEMELLRTCIVPAAAALYLREIARTFPTKKRDILKMVEALEIRDFAGMMLDVDIWATIQRGSGARHPDHIHEGAIVSGVFYANMPTGSAPLVLRRPNSGDEASSANGIIEKESRNHNPVVALDGFEQLNDQGDLVFRPSEGSLIIFPPWLYHGVPSVEGNVNNSNPTNESGERVSFAFNVTCIRSWDGLSDLTRLTSE